MEHVFQSGYRILMTLAHLWCHQIPERSPHIYGVQFPLCWRCSGIAAGALALLFYLGVRRRLPSLTTSLLLALQLPLDVLVNSLGFDADANLRRFLTGTLWGFYGTSAVLLLLPRFLQLFRGRKNFPMLAAAALFSSRSQ